MPKPSKSSGSGELPALETVLRSCPWCSERIRPHPTHPSLLLRMRDAADADAWDTFVAQYVPVIYGYCRRHGLQESDARDVVQDVLASVAGAIKTFEYDPGKGKFRSWLGVVTHRAMLKVRHRGRQPDQQGGDDSPALDGLGHVADPVWLDEVNQQIFRVARARVAPEFKAPEWAVFEMVWEQQVPASEAAERLGRDVAWVYKAKFRILQRLKAEMLLLASDWSIFND